MKLAMAERDWRLGRYQELWTKVAVDKIWRSDSGGDLHDHVLISFAWEISFGVEVWDSDGVPGRRCSVVAKIVLHI